MGELVYARDGMPFPVRVVSRLNGFDAQYFSGGSGWAAISCKHPLAGDAIAKADEFAERNNYPAPPAAAAKE